MLEILVNFIQWIASYHRNQMARIHSPINSFRFTHFQCILSMYNNIHPKERNGNCKLLRWMAFLEQDICTQYVHLHYTYCIRSIDNKTILKGLLENNEFVNWKSEIECRIDICLAHVLFSLEFSHFGWLICHLFLK